VCQVGYLQELYRDAGQQNTKSGDILNVIQTQKLCLHSPLNGFHFKDRIAGKKCANRMDDNTATTKTLSTIK